MARIANPVLLFAGAGSIIVAIVGLFVRASPILSGAFLVAGTLMLVASAIELPFRDRREPSASAPPDMDLVTLERSARAAETEIAHGELHAPSDATTPVRTYMSKKAEDKLRHAESETAGAVTRELQALPTLELTSQVAPLSDVAAGYRALTLPSGYMVMYRRLTPVEIKDSTGMYNEVDSYLVADLVPLIPAGARRPTP
jgi:hypothetical protein